MAIIDNHPTFGYVFWSGLIIIGEDKTPYVINDDKTMHKYIYWETSNPYILKTTDEKLPTSVSRFLIYINNSGSSTQVPQDLISIQYRDGAGVLVSKISGKVDEIDGKYFSIKEDVDGIKEVIGSSETSEEGTLIDKINKIEKTASGNTELIKEIQTTYDEDKETEALRDGISSSLIAMLTALSEYQNEVYHACEDFDITTEEKESILKYQENMMQKVNVVYGYHEDLIKRIDNDNNIQTINLLNLAKTNLETTINNLNTNVSTSISDSTVVPSEITIMLNMFGTVGVRANEYRETLNEAVILGIGGEIIENIFSSTSTATEFNQKMSSIVEIIDGESGLKKQIESNATNIKQTAEDIKLNYVKFDEVTAELTVADDVIKLDAGKVLMTGTLTWDSLDNDAKVNLKGEKGENGQDGENAKYVVISGEQVFKYTNGNDTPTPSSIVLVASRFNTTVQGKWQYKASNGSYIDLGITTDTLEITPSSGELSNKDSCTFRYITEQYSDEITVVKISDGENGKKGETFYTWVMYADDEKGNGLSNNPNNKEYIGLSYNNTSSIESTDPSLYKWSLIKGEDGVEGAKGENGITYYTWIKYSDYADGSDMYDTPKSSTKYIGLGVNKLSQEESTNKADYSWSQFRGDDGVDGNDAYTVILTNENHSFICESDNSIKTEVSTTSQVLAYKGVDLITSTIGEIIDPSGLAITVNGTTITFTAITGTSLANNGTVEIPIIVDGITFKRMFSWTKVQKGEKGDTGDANVPDWVKEWDSNVTTINGSQIVTPKIFAGSSNNGKPTGVAMGENVFGTTNEVNGIVGYKDGIKTYEFNSDGNILIGNKSEEYISWDGENLDINVNALKVNSSNVATETFVGNKIGEVAIQEVKNVYYLSDSRTELVNGTWEDIIIETQDGKYLWTRTMTIYKNGTIEYSEPSCISNSNDGYIVVLSKEVCLIQCDEKGNPLK